MPYLVKAGDNGELLFWLLVAAVWIVVQVLARLAQRQRMEEGKPGAEGEIPEKEEKLVRILQEITGVKVEVPVPRPPPEPEIAAAAVEPAIVTRTVEPQTAQPAAAMEREAAADEGYVRREPIAVAPTSLVTMPLPREALSYTAAMKAPITPVSVIPLEPILPGRYRPDFHDRESLRRAIVASIVLGPPIAMCPSYAPEF